MAAGLPKRRRISPGTPHQRPLPSAGLVPFDSSDPRSGFVPQRASEAVRRRERLRTQNMGNDHAEETT